MDIVKDSVELDITSHELTQKTNEVVVSADTALEISGLKKEYSIVGDSLYAGVSSDSPPQWLANIIDNVVNSLIGQKLTALDTAVNSINASLRELEIAKNQYQQLINIEETIDGVLVSKLETLNATVQQNSASIIDLDVVKTTAEEALAITINHLNSEINNGEISSLITQLNATIANNELAAAESINQLEAVYNENESTVREILSTSTGEYTAEANAITELNVNINDAVFGVTGLENTLRGEITSEGAKVESKFAYNSNLNLNGTNYLSGFGLATSLISGSIPAGSSEFWINASKLKFTNNNITGSTAPFTIDASGATPQITFNGKVSFSNVTGAPGGGSNLLYNSAPMIANETKGWSVGWYNTGIAPVLGAGWDPWRPSGGGSVYVVVPGAPTVGTVFDVAQTTKVPVIGGTWYEASAYTSSHRCTSYVTIAWYDSNNMYIREVGGSQTAIASGGALSNWSRSTLLAQAPTNAAKAHFYVRSIVNSTDPYCFVAFAYLGKAVQGQAVFSDWSEGTSAGVSSGEVVNDINNGNTTTIDGGKITTGSIGANKIAAGSITADRLSVSTLSAVSANLGTVNAGVMYNSGASASNYTMKIDLNAGEIHIK